MIGWEDDVAEDREVDCEACRGTGTIVLQASVSDEQWSESMGEFAQAMRAGLARFAPGAPDGERQLSAVARFELGLLAQAIEGLP